MANALIEGIIIGLTLAFLIGPSFISLLQTSIHRGFYAGVQFAFGIVLSDITLIALSYFGALQFLGADQNQLRMGIIGGLIVIGFGVVTFTRRYHIASPVNVGLGSKTERFFSGKLFKYISKGYFMNIFNPFLLIFWLGVMSLVSTKYSIPSREILLFFSGTVAAVFATDLFKCVVANRIKKKLTPRVLTMINRFVGVLLVAFGIGLIVRVVYYL